MAISIKVLGPGCPNCERVEEHVLIALEELSDEDASLEATIQHVTDREEIMKHVFATPGLMINNEVVCAGRIPTVDETKAWIQGVLEGA
jgi:small redox-active disulfide protein 2